jgi:hypothetical protein
LKGSKEDLLIVSLLLQGREIELQSSSLGFEENRHELGLEILLRISNANRQWGFTRGHAFMQKP